MLFDVCRHLLYLSKLAIRRIYSVTAALFISNMVTVDSKCDIENLIDLSRYSSVSKFYHSIYSKTIISLLSLSFWVFFDSFHIRLFFSQNLFFFPVFWVGAATTPSLVWHTLLFYVQSKETTVGLISILLLLVESSSFEVISILLWINSLDVSTLFQKVVWLIGVSATAHKILAIKTPKKILNQQKYIKTFRLQTLISPKQ